MVEIGFTQKGLPEGEKEFKIRLVVIRGENDLGLKVVDEVIKEWDREGEGCFAGYLLEGFPRVWMRKVREN